MNISLVTQKKIKIHPGSNVEKLELSSAISRYLEFDDSAVFLLYDELRNSEVKIIGVKFSNKSYKLYPAWEFQIIDGLGKTHEIVLMEKRMFENKEVIYSYGWGFDIGYYLDPNTGEILHEEPIK